jgi:hypothetical protein
MVPMGARTGPVRPLVPLLESAACVTKATRVLPLVIAGRPV